MREVMLALTLLSALTALPDAALLGHDDFDTRQAASRRLAARGPLALPALLLAERSADLEARSRAAALAAWYHARSRDGLDAAFAARLFWGPGTRATAASAAGGIWVAPHSALGDRLTGMTPLEHNRLACWARAWGLVGKDEAVAGELDHYDAAPGAAGWEVGFERAARVGWVNVVRHRAWGLKMPGE